MEPKPRSTGSKSGKSEKTVSGNTHSAGIAAATGASSGPEKKESAPKEVPAPLAKKTSGPSEITPAANPTKPPVVETGNQEASGATAESDSKANDAEGESSSSFFENMKPLLLAGGVVVAAIAVILGVAFFARKK